MNTYSAPVQSKTVYTSSPAAHLEYSSAPIGKTIQYAAPVAKAIQYSAPVAVTKSVQYSTHEPAQQIYQQAYQPAAYQQDQHYEVSSGHYAAGPAYTQVQYAAAPVAKVVAPVSNHYETYESSPVLSKTVSYSAPAKTLAYASPVKTVSYAPQAVSYAVPSKTLAYAAPTKTVSYGSNVAYASPLKTVSYSAPAVTKTISYAAPAKAYTYSAPTKVTYTAPQVSYAPSISYNTPAIGHAQSSTIQSHDATVSHYSKSIETPYSSVQKYNTQITSEPSYYNVHASAPQAVQYAHAAPVVQYAAAAPVVSQKSVSYSPASAVSHASFEGHGAHYHW